MSGKRGRRKVSFVKLAVATLGLAGAVYAAEQATSPPATEDLQSIIRGQRAAEGRPVIDGKTDEHQVQSFSPAQLVEMTARYDGEMKAALAHADTLRVISYKSRDLIRMTCIDDKIAQMTAVVKAVEGDVQALAAVGPDELRMRQRFLSIQQARQRVTELAAEMEECTGDNLARVSVVGRIKEEVLPDATNIHDPSRPPAPNHEIERPGEASPYR